MITYANTTKEDVDYVVDHLREDDAREIFATRPDENREDYKQDLWFRCRFSFCVKLDGEPIAILAAFTMWPGVWMTFLVGTDRFTEGKFTIAKIAKKIIIPTLQEDMNAHLLFTYSIVGRSDAKPWLAWLGGTNDCTIKGYGKNGEDYEMWCLRKKGVS